MNKKFKIFHKAFAVVILLSFTWNSIIPVAYAQSMLNLPKPGVRVPLSPAFYPAIIKGMKIFPENPLRFDFIVDTGNSQLKDEALKTESTKLIKYFLASLTVPEENLWVNLSPYEKNRIIPDDFGQTEMGRDLLAQDYLLKQITASLIHPEEALGKEFWDKVYKKANRLYGTSEIPVNTFNKVWIVPEKAIVYEDGDTIFIAESHLKVMLEEDYLALQHNSLNSEIGANKLKTTDVEKLSEVTSSILREVVIPELEKEVNEGKNFTNLRQIYNSMILATWFKRNLKESLLGKIYVDQHKLEGIETKDTNMKEKIYQQYLEAFKKGTYDYIKEDYDETTQKVVVRKYFSGGVVLDPEKTHAFGSTTDRSQAMLVKGSIFQMAVNLVPHSFANQYIAKNIPDSLKSGDIESRRLKLSQYQQVSGFGRSARLIPIKGLLQNTGLFAQVGLGQAYGEPVIYIDADYVTNEVVSEHELYEINKWEEKRAELGLESHQMRQWILDHYEEAKALADQWHSEAPSIEKSYKQAGINHTFFEDIARIYTQERDVLIAAGEFGDDEEDDGLGDFDLGIFGENQETRSGLSDSNLNEDLGLFNSWKPFGGNRRNQSGKPKSILKERKASPSRISLRKEDFVNLGLIDEGRWDMKELFPRFQDASEDVINLLIDRISNPSRVPGEIERLRRNSKALFDSLREDQSDQGLEKLKELSRLVKSFHALAYAEEGESFYTSLRYLRNYHYLRPQFTGLVHNIFPFPEVSVSLIRIAQFISILQRIEASLPEDVGIPTSWKSRIRKILERSELKPFLDRPHFLKVAVEYPNPFIFVDENGWNSNDRDNYHLEGYSAVMQSARRVQGELTKRGEFEAVLKEFKELADPNTGLLRNLWEINIPTEKQEQKFSSERELRAYLKKNGLGAKHTFLRSFPDAAFKNILREMDFYVRFAKTMILDGYRFADLSSEQSTIKIDHFWNPLVEGKVKEGESKLPPKDEGLEEKITRQIQEKKNAIEPISIELGEGKNALLISGPNMGGKTETARAVVLAVLLNQAGLPIPANSGQLSVFKNIYSVFPRPDQLQEGHGYFANLLKELTELTKKAGPGDLILLDEVPTGTDYNELVAVTVVILEDLIKRGATVVVTGHLKKAFELVSKKTGQQPYMQTVDMEGKPDYKLSPGIAKRSYGIELTKEAGFPSEVTELAKTYYDMIMDGMKSAQWPELKIEEEKAADEPEGEKAEEEQEESPNTSGIIGLLLKRMYTEDLFAFPNTVKGVRERLFEAPGAAEKTKQIIGQLGGKKETLTLGDVNQQLELTAFWNSQTKSFVEEIQKALKGLMGLNPKDRYVDYWNRPEYKHTETMKRIQALTQALEAIKTLLDPLKENDFVKKVIAQIDGQLEKINSTRKMFADDKGKGLDKELTIEAIEKRPEPFKGNPHVTEFLEYVKKGRKNTLLSKDGKVLDKDVLQGLEKIWQAVWQDMHQQAMFSLIVLDQINGITLAIRKHNLKSPRFVDDDHIFSMENVPPFSTQGLWDDAPPFMKNGKSQTLRIDPQKPIFVLTGPNSSGKTALMLTVYMNAFLALHGFYVSGDVEMSRFDGTFAFFGGNNISGRGKSYFMDVLEKYSEMIKKATPNSFIVLDELHGTDNFELAAIQLAILQYFRQKNVTVLYNTHIRDGLKLLADRLGLDLWKTDVTFKEVTAEVKASYTISPDPNLKSKSYGLAVAKPWLTDEQFSRAQAVYGELTNTGDNAMLSAVKIPNGLLTGLPDAIESLKDRDLNGVSVLVRTNQNVPISDDGKTGDPTRLQEAVPILKFLLDKGANVILIGHHGRLEEGGKDGRKSLKPTEEFFQQQFPDVSVKFYLDSINQDGLNITASDLVKDPTKKGKGSLHILENVRFASDYEEGKRGSPKREEFARKLTELAKAKIFIIDAYGDIGSKGASIEDLPKQFSSNGGEFYVGPSMIQEAEKLATVVQSGVHAVIMGGVKPDKVEPVKEIVESTLTKDGFVLLGSAPSSQLKKDNPLIKGMVERNEERVLIASDYSTADDTFDIGPATIDAFKKKLDTLQPGQNIIVNGTMGWVEAGHIEGTKKIFRKLGELAERGVNIIFIGGDASANARNKDYGLNPEQLKRVILITGGGVPLKILAGKELVGVKALKEAGANDKAMMSAPGGIDLNPSNLNLQTRGSGLDYNIPANYQNFENFQINGFTPVIFQIVPMTNLPLYLGANESIPFLVETVKKVPVI